MLNFQMLKVCYNLTRNLIYDLVPHISSTSNGVQKRSRSVLHPNEGFSQASHIKNTFFKIMKRLIPGAPFKLSRAAHRKHYFEFEGGLSPLFEI